MYSLIPANRVRIDAHSGAHGQFLVIYQAAVAAQAAGGIEALDEFHAAMFERIADTRNLRAAWDYLAAHGGEAPGPNGWRYDDFDNREVWTLVRILNEQILSGDYIPGPDRKVKISKGPGGRTRTLRLQNILDRVVARAIVQIVQPLLEATFAPLSFGGRPDRNRWDALAHAERMSSQLPGTAWIVADIRNAFDNVPLGRLQDVVTARFRNPEFNALVGRVIGNCANRGLRQGSPLSPLLMNLYLDHFLDRPWQREHADTPLIRFVDDLLLICPQGRDPMLVHAELCRHLTPAGMPLKGDAAASIHWLDRGDQFAWLGYQVSGASGKLQFELPLGNGDGGWLDQLRESLASAHAKLNTPIHANQILLGAIENLAPCVNTFDPKVLYEHIKAMAAELSFEEIPHWEIFEDRLKAARGRWERVRARILAGEGADGAPKKKRRPPLYCRLCRGEYIVYTDGACRANNFGGAAWAILTRSGELRLKRRGRLSGTTNNRAELHAVIRALSYIASGSTILIRSDSAYVCNGINEDLARWKLNGWRRGRPGQLGRLENADLWQKLDERLQLHRAKAVWVPAHSGNRWNELCDRLAFKAAHS